MGLKVVTFGCRLNTYESEVMREKLETIFGEDFGGDVTLFNSCTVTSEAERQLRQAIRKERRENPKTKIIIVGCAVQADPEKYLSMEEVDMVLGNKEKMQIDKYVSSLKSDVESEEKEKELAKSFVGKTEDIDIRDLHLIRGIEGRSRAFVEIQTGCDHFCTYCIIPYARGKNSSFSPEKIIEQIKLFCSNGYNEVVLTGVDITCYGKDLKTKITLAELVKKILAEVPELPLLRLSSVDVAEIDEELFELIASEERIAPHIHLSLQSGNDMILKRMKRRHTKNDILSFCKRLTERRPNVAFGADIITGFPTETDEMFSDSVDVIKKAPIVFGHIFPYSEREGTPAAKMPPVPKSIRKERAKILRSAAEAELKNFLQKFIGQKFEVLVENEDYVRLPNFVTGKMDKKLPKELIGRLIDVSVSGISDKNLITHKI